MNLRTTIIREVSEWFGVDPAQISGVNLTTDPEVDPNEKQALALVCYFLTHRQMKDSKMESVDVAKYFGVSEVQILRSLNQREYWETSSGSYRMVKQKVQTIIENYLVKIYG